MKKLLGLLLLTLVSVAISAQEHLSFKGIPIDGKMDSFVSNLKSNGFTQITVTDNAALFEGDFGGEMCQVAVYASKTTKTVYQVIVILEESDSWSTIKSTYKEYKSLLTSKYGKGDSFEYFSDPYYEGDGYEISALRNSKCHYATNYETISGEIRLGLGFSNEAIVMLAYTDKLNEELAEQEEAGKRVSDL